MTNRALERSSLKTPRYDAGVRHLSRIISIDIAGVAPRVLKVAAVVASVSLGFANPGALANDKGIEIAQRTSVAALAQLNRALRYVDEPLFATYVASMERYMETALALAVEGKAFTPQFQPRIGHIAPPPWTWVALNGNSVRRVRDGLFRIYVRDYHANWFSTLDCTEIQWPLFRCKDGTQRVMKVIDTSSIRFGEQEYFRAVAQVKQ